MYIYFIIISFFSFPEKCILSFLQQRELILKESTIGTSLQISFHDEDVFALEILGKGGFGIVQKVYHKMIGKYVAVKYFNETSSPDEEEEQFWKMNIDDDDD